ncbi:MAG TPA: GNAT family N-acetyltransferase [Prolixibacteraceae bacterium]|nr:GNAT family N-acetyltransferase [Prolixibacteraceae bacterium]HPR59764.1 GNAT family N-acetyltransferase [Prolixibacteraceae bacterium]
MTISSKNIRLRALEPSDVELLYNWENNPEVWRVSNTYAPLSKFILANYIKSNNADIWENKQLRLVIENEQEVAIGTVELFDFEPYHSRAGVGIVIFEHSERGKGKAVEALELLIEYSRNTLGISQLYVNVAESNITSLKLFEKLGFEITGRKKQWLRKPNGWEDEYILQKQLVLKA